MNQLERFAEAVRYCAETYKGSTNDVYFGRNYFWRCPKDIKASGEIHYLCCSERTLMISQHALEEGLEHKLALLRVKRFCEMVRFGTALELVLDGVVYKFISGNNGDLLRQGECKPDKKRTHIYTVEASLDDSKSYFGHFGFDSVEELEKYIPGLDFTRFEKKVRRKSKVKDFNRRANKIARHRRERKNGILVT